MRSRMVFIWSALVIAFGVACAPSVARADTDKAREYFQKAQRAYGDNEYERAAELLEKAYAEEANLTYQYNRIRALQGAEKYEKALDVLKTYEKPMLDAEGFEDIRDIENSLQQKVDAEDPGASSSATKSAAEEKEPANSTPSSSGGSPAGTSGSPGSGGAAATTDPGMQVLGWGLAGTGAASIGIGTLFGSLTLLPPDIREDARNDNVKPGDVDVVRDHRTATIVFLAAGTGALIGGGILLYDQFSAGSETSAARSADGPRVQWRPFATPETAGATLEVRF